MSVAGAVRWGSLFAVVYYLTVYLGNRHVHGPLLGAVLLAAGAVLAGVRVPDLRSRGAAWFRGGMPTSPAGWAATLAAVALCVLRFLAVDAHAHSVSDTLVGTLPVWSLVAGAWFALGRATGAPGSTA